MQLENKQKNGRPSPQKKNSGIWLDPGFSIWKNSQTAGFFSLFPASDRLSLIHIALVDTAADNIIPRNYIPRQGFPGERSCVPVSYTHLVTSVSTLDRANLRMVSRAPVIRSRELVPR